MKERTMNSLTFMNEGEKVNSLNFINERENNNQFNLNEVKVI